MGLKPQQDLTAIMGRARQGDERAKGELIVRVYDELRRMAGRLMRRERTGHTLSTTGVVHEAVIRLLDRAVFDRAGNRSYLFAAAARAMRQVLVDHARRRSAERHGGRLRRVPLDMIVADIEEQKFDVAAVHEALDRLAEWNGRLAQVMTLRYFGQLTIPEVAAALAISTATVERDWRLARAWLRGQLEGRDE
jgi:RNA polymerase sigma-70 factor (ECF subfamily)